MLHRTAFSHSGKTAFQEQELNLVELFHRSCVLLTARQLQKQTKRTEKEQALLQLQIY